MGRKGTVDAKKVQELREVPLARALDRLGVYVARDRDFAPVKADTERWICNVPERAGVYVLLVTGQKWFDEQAGKGGGGAIDLVMHLWGVEFLPATKKLLAAVQVTGSPP